MYMMLQLLPTSSAIIQSHGEVQEKATKEYIENLSTLENGIHNDLPSIGPFINGEKPGLLDVIMGSYSKGIRVLADLDRWKGATGEGEGYAGFEEQFTEDSCLGRGWQCE